MPKGKHMGPVEGYPKIQKEIAVEPPTKRYPGVPEETLVDPPTKRYPEVPVEPVVEPVEPPDPRLVRLEQAAKQIHLGNIKLAAAALFDVIFPDEKK